MGSWSNDDFKSQQTKTYRDTDTNIVTRNSKYTVNTLQSMPHSLVVSFEYRLQIRPQSPVGKPVVFAQFSVRWQLPACRLIVCWFVTIVVSCCCQFLLIPQIEFRMQRKCELHLQHASFLVRLKQWRSEEARKPDGFWFSCFLLRHISKQYLTAKSKQTKLAMINSRSYSTFVFQNRSNTCQLIFGVVL